MNCAKTKVKPIRLWLCVEFVDYNNYGDDKYRAAACECVLCVRNAMHLN